MFKRGLLAVLTLLALLLLVLVVRALVLPAPALSARVLPSLPEQDRDAQVERLAQAIRFPTLADRPEAFDAFHAFLAEAFPLTHETLSLRPFGHSLLYHWDSGHDCAPTLLLAHQDVVPVSAMAEWQHPPFDGVVDEQFIWGRGTLDDKVSVMAILEAVEAMLAEGRQPACDVWLAFGHDEETGGAQGAARMAAWLQEQGVRFELVLDEGGMVLPGATLGIQQPVALIGIAEKGYISVTLEAHGEPGHSSRPPAQTAIGDLAVAIARLQANPRPAGLSLPTRYMLETVAPEQAFARRLVFANLWLFEPLVVRQLAGNPETHALIRTTMAPTMLSGGVKDNVLPATASAVINFRLAPGETQESLLNWVERHLPEGVSVSIKEGFFAEPSRISPANSDAFERVASLAQALPGDPLPAPFLMIAGSDARHYQALSENVLRFLPVSLQQQDIARFHGPNERLARDQYPDMVRFYLGLLSSGAAQ